MTDAKARKENVGGEGAFATSSNRGVQPETKREFLTKQLRNNVKNW